MEFRQFTVKNCARCPNIKKVRTPNSGYAEDYICTETNKIAVGYVEWPSELPKDGQFPSWCPLPKTKTSKMEK